MDLKEITDAIESLEGKAADVLEKVNAAESAEDREQAQTEVKALQDRLEVLESEKEKAEAEMEVKALREQVETLTGKFEEARRTKDFSFNPATGASSEESDSTYGEQGERSFYADVKAAHGGDSRAWQRLEDAIKDSEGKAMIEGTDAAGGFLVPPEISTDLITLRDTVSVLRPLIPSHQISVDELRIAAVDSGLAVAWTAELTEKTQSEFSFSELSANVFTAAGLAIASNQLLKDNTFGLDRLINSDLAKRFVALEEQAILNGSGTGQPRGIRQTNGVNQIPLKGEVKAESIIDAIITATTEIYTNYFGAPNAIVMHPRTWGFLVKARESGTPNSYILGAPSTVYGRNPADQLPGYSGASVPRGELFGMPVYTTPNVPTNLGTSGEESVIYVGNWTEALILDREGITTDQSEHVFFTSNQTVFRSEERLGFTAARYPKAFAVIEGSGLKGV